MCHAHAVALAVCTAAALLLIWPLLTGQILFGGTRSDMYIAGYSFRLFGAQHFLEYGAIPQWNPYLFGGLPYIGAMHGDIFYPTAWLRWIMPVDLAITWGMAVHFVLAGWFMYRFVRALGVSWGAAVFAGVAYELTGIVASQMSPGHDGKLFVSALTPLAFWMLLLAIRHRKAWAYGAFAFVVALNVLGHYHMAYFLLLALGLWTLFLCFWYAERPPDLRPWRSIGFATLAALVGLSITSLQVLPFLEYIPHSPRAAAGPDTGWAFATSYAFPPGEIFTLLLPQFNGVLDHYWGWNPIKFHTEYMGFLPLVLVALAFGDKSRRRLVIAIGSGALLFLLFSFAGHTPFYRPFFELLPLVKKIRAMGMVFYLAAFFLCVLAGIGLDRVLARAVSLSTVLAVCGTGAAIALIGALGGLQPIAETLALPERYDAVAANAPFLRAGALRLLLFAVLGGALLWATVTGRVRHGLALAGIVLLAGIDLWSVNRQFFTFSPRASTLFADDPVTAYLRKVQPPFRVFDAAYGHSILMAYRIPVATGYHGFQLRRYNELAGAREGFTPNLLDLLAIRYLIVSQPRAIPGYHEVVGPVLTAAGTSAVLYERDSIPPWARVLPSAAKVDEAEAVNGLVDPRFPLNGVALLPDTSTAAATEPRPPFIPSRVTATVTEWRPGAMTISLQGADTALSHLLVSENWYPDWRAEVDGKEGTVRRANHTLLSVDLPPGARDVRLWFESRAYYVGTVISGVAVLFALVMIALPVFVSRRPGTIY